MAKFLILNIDSTNQCSFRQNMRFFLYFLLPRLWFEYSGCKWNIQRCMSRLKSPLISADRRKTFQSCVRGGLWTVGSDRRIETCLTSKSISIIYIHFTITKIKFSGKKKTTTHFVVIIIMIGHVIFRCILVKVGNLKTNMTIYVRAFSF